MDHGSWTRLRGTQQAPKAIGLSTAGPSGSCGCRRPHETGRSRPAAPGPSSRPTPLLFVPMFAVLWTEQASAIALRTIAECIGHCLLAVTYGTRIKVTVASLTGGHRESPFADSWLCLFLFPYETKTPHVRHAAHLAELSFRRRPFNRSLGRMRSCAEDGSFVMCCTVDGRNEHPAVHLNEVAAFAAIHADVDHGSTTSAGTSARWLTIT
jgi:hypothetical protein